MGLDYSYWVDDEAFDLRNHVYFHTLPKPGDWRQLMEVAEPIVAKGLDMSRPMWEIHIIEGLDHVEGYPEGCFAMIHKKHHGQFDGGSATYLKSVMHTLEPIKLGAKGLAPTKPVEREKAPTPLQLLQRAYYNILVRNPIKRLEFANRTLRSVPAALEAAAKDARRIGGQVPRTRWSRVIPSPRRVLGVRTFALSQCQLLRGSCAGSTINDIVLTIYSGAVRKYLLHHNELPAKPLKVMLPVSVRKEEEIGDLGNKIYNMLVLLHTEVADPLECMTMIHDETVFSKEVLDTIGARNMSDMLEVAPLGAIDGSIKAAMRMKIANTIPGLYSGVAISNVPGSKVPFYFCGAKQQRMFNWGFLMDGMGLLLVAGSYSNEIVCTAVSCPDLMPDMDFFEQCMEETFNELCTTCQVPVVKDIPKAVETAPAERMVSPIEATSEEVMKEAVETVPVEATDPDAAMETPVVKKTRGAKKQQ